MRRKTGKGECIFAPWYFVELMDMYAPGDKGLSNVCLDLASLGFK